MIGKGGKEDQDMQKTGSRKSKPSSISRRVDFEPHKATPKGTIWENKTDLSDFVNPTDDAFDHLPNLLARQLDVHNLPSKRKGRDELTLGDVGRRKRRSNPTTIGHGERHAVGGCRGELASSEEHRIGNSIAEGTYSI